MVSILNGKSTSPILVVIEREFCQPEDCKAYATSRMFIGCQQEENSKSYSWQKLSFATSLPYTTMVEVHKWRLRSRFISKNFANSKRNELSQICDLNFK